MNAQLINGDTNHKTEKRGKEFVRGGVFEGGREGADFCPFKPRYKKRAKRGGGSTVVEQRPAARGNKNVNWPPNMQFCRP